MRKSIITFTLALFVASSCLPVRAEANRCGEVLAGTIPQAIPLRLWFPMVTGQ